MLNPPRTVLLVVLMSLAGFAAVQPASDTDNITPQTTRATISPPTTALEGEQGHAGTIGDPKSKNEPTWPGAIHDTTAGGRHLYFASTVRGQPPAEGWRYPPVANNSAEWTYVGESLHSGVVGDPKQWDELTWVSALHATEIDGKRAYFTAQSNGVPSYENWAYPTPPDSDAHWRFVKVVEHAGTYEDPKGTGVLTSPGHIHRHDSGREHLYFASRIDGLAPEFPEAGAVSDDNWTYLGRSRHAGTLKDPKDRDELVWPGQIDINHVGDQYLYFAAKLAGVPSEPGWEYPTTATSNEHWTSAGTGKHLGAYNDPKKWDEFTWPGAIHADQIEGKHAFFVSQFSGLPSAQTPPPTALASNDSWVYLGASEHSGTFEDPKTTTEMTWPGAISAVFAGDERLYFSSLVEGSNSYLIPADKSSNAGWAYVGTNAHAGTYQDPKGWDDPTWPGQIHVSTSNGKQLYFALRQGDGIPSENDWPFPAIDNSNERWEYAGESKHEGNVADPKGQNEITWVGAVHVLHDAEQSRYYVSQVEGDASTHDWPLPLEPGNNQYWTWAGRAKNPGTFKQPKTQDDMTWMGAIHSIESDGHRVYFQSRVEGTPSQHDWPYPAPPASNAHWDYLGKDQHAGTSTDPKGAGDWTWPEAIHTLAKDNQTLYFQSNGYGMPPEAGWNYPDTPSSNNAWTFIGSSANAGMGEAPKNRAEATESGKVEAYQYDDAHRESRAHAGTFTDPKKWDEPTWPGQIHDYLYNGRHMYFSSLVEGIPSERGWHYPTTETSNNQWTYRGTSQHAGTYEAPKEWDEITWPGAIHYYEIAGQRVYFRALNEGNASDSYWYYPTTFSSNSNWTYLGKHWGTLEDPKYWDEPTWIGAVHKTGIYYFTSRFDGNASATNYHYPAAPNSNTYWTYGGEHLGTLAEPKHWEEPTLPGEIHRYDYHGKVLYFAAKQEGDPSKNNWYYPTTETSNNNWTYLGKHVGTYADPKEWDEPTRLGAVHDYLNGNKHLYFTSRFNGNARDRNYYYPTSATSNAYWTYLKSLEETAPGINDFSKPFGQYTWVTAHNAYLNNMQEQLARGVRGFMLDLHPSITPPGAIILCHGSPTACTGPNLANVLSNTFLPFLKNNPRAVLTLHLESYVTHAQLQDALNQVNPELGAYIFNTADFKTRDWPTLQDMISRNKRLIIISGMDATAGNFNISNVNFTIVKDTNYTVENTYNIGTTAFVHDWSCQSRNGNLLSTPIANISPSWQRLFVMNQFHAWGGSQADAGNIDNNLTYLMRRVERYCAEPSNHKNPNFIALDFNQVGDGSPYAAALSQGGLYFYEQNNASTAGDTVCVLPANRNYDLRLPTKGCENDEARSLQLRGVRAGTRITLYDSPDANRQDDFVIIDVKSTIPLKSSITINSFETSQSNAQVNVMAFHNNGLDGKVSRIRVGRTPAANDFSDAAIVFYEGNNGAQNIVCTVPFAKHSNFRMGYGNNAYGCDNDEIRSGRIISAKKNSSFAFAGHPGGSFSQGRASVTIKQDILMPVLIPSFNRSYEDSNVKVVVDYGGNLDGKISYGWFGPTQ